MPSLAKQIVMF